MIVRIVKLTFREDSVATFEAYFPTVSTTIRNQQGCNLLQAWHDINNPHIFFTYSLWDSEADLNAYRASEFFGIFWKTVKPWFGEKAEAWSFEKIIDLK